MPLTRAIIAETTDGLTFIVSAAVPHPSGLLEFPFTLRLGSFDESLTGTLELLDLDGASKSSLAKTGTAETSFKDNDGGILLQLSEVSSSVNYVRIANAATASAVAITAQGADSDINLTISALGAGNVDFTHPVTMADTLDVTGNVDAGSLGVDNDATVNGNLQFGTVGPMADTPFSGVVDVTTTPNLTFVNGVLTAVSP